MIVDLHCHYPMHIAADPKVARALWQMTRIGRATFGDKVKALILWLASRWFNYKNADAPPATLIPSLRKGGVGVALSVLYSPFSELDLEKPYGSPPDSSYYGDLVQLLEKVEDDILRNHADGAAIARSPDDMDRILAENKVALVHAIEGGFHVGATPEQIDRNLRELASRGVAYVTVAHLFYRGIALNAPALPFLSDKAYEWLFPESGAGLTPLGEALVRAMVQERVLIDITHMNEKSMDETFALIDALDPARSIPVIASHIGCRIGNLEYNIDDRHLLKLAERGGVMGIILCDHHLRDGVLDHQTGSFEESMKVIRAQVDRVHEITNSYDHIAIGTDLDGFIKPTLKGLDDASKLAKLAEALGNAYGPAIAEKICSTNALRVLRSYWRSSAARAVA